MTTTVLNGHYFPTSFPIIGNNPVNYRTNAVPRKAITLLPARRCSNDHQTWEAHAGNIDPLREYASHFLSVIFPHTFHAICLFIGTYSIFRADLIPLFSAHQPFLWNEFTHFYRDLTRLYTTLTNYQQARTHDCRHILHYSSFLF